MAGHVTEKNPTRSLTALPNQRITVMSGSYGDDDGDRHALFGFVSNDVWMGHGSVRVSVSSPPLDARSQAT